MKENLKTAVESLLNGIHLSSVEDNEAGDTLYARADTVREMLEAESRLIEAQSAEMKDALQCLSDDVQGQLNAIDRNETDAMWDVYDADNWEAMGEMIGRIADALGVKLKYPKAEVN